MRKLLALLSTCTTLIGLPAVAQTAIPAPGCVPGVVCSALSFNAGTAPLASTVHILDAPAAVAGGAPIISVGAPTFNATVDPSVYLGINQLQDGSLPNGSYPGLAWALENNYNDGVTIKQEAYLQSVFTDLTTIRPIFVQVEPSTKHITSMTIRGGALAQGFGVTFSDDAASPTTTYRFLPSSFQMFPITGQNTIFDLSAPSTKGTNLQLGRNGIDGVLVLSTAGANNSILQMYDETAMATNTVMHFYSRPLGTTGTAVAIGVDDNGAALTAKASLASQKGVVARAFNVSQTANLFEAQTSTPTTVWSIGPTGAEQVATVAIGGATIGTDALSVTGTVSTSSSIIAGGFVSSGGNVVAGATSAFSISGRGILSSPAAGTWQFGNADAASPVAQILQFQNGSGSNIVGVNATVVAPLSTGNATNPDLIFQTGVKVASGSGAPTKTTAVVIRGETGLIRNPTIISDAGLTDASVCEDTTNHEFHSGSGTLGICLGTSSERYKHGIEPLVPGLADLLKLRPVSYHLNSDYGDETKLYYGFTAEAVQPILPALVGLDSEGRPNTADYLGMVPVLIKAVQQEQAEIVVLKARVAKLERRLH